MTEIEIERELKKRKEIEKGTVVGIDIGVSPRVDMIPRFKNLPLDLIRKQSHFALIFLALLCNCVYQICLEKSTKELKREGPTTSPHLRTKEKGRGDKEREEEEGAILRYSVVQCNRFLRLKVKGIKGFPFLYLIIYSTPTRKSNAYCRFFFLSFLFCFCFFFFFY